MVLTDRTPPDSQSSTWVERGHARRLGRRETDRVIWFCPSCDRALDVMKKASGLSHGEKDKGGSVRESIGFFLDGYAALA